MKLTHNVSFLSYVLKILKSLIIIFKINSNCKTVNVIININLKHKIIY